MHCIECGLEFEDFDREQVHKFLPPIAEATCPECGKNYTLIDYRSIDQERHCRNNISLIVRNRLAEGSDVSCKRSSSKVNFN